MKKIVILLIMVVAITRAQALEGIYTCEIKTMFTGKTIQTYTFKPNGRLVVNTFLDKESLTGAMNKLLNEFQPLAKEMYGNDNELSTRLSYIDYGDENVFYVESGYDLNEYSFYEQNGQYFLKLTKSTKNDGIFPKFKCQQVNKQTQQEPVINISEEEAIRAEAGGEGLDQIPGLHYIGASEGWSKLILSSGNGNCNLQFYKTTPDNILVSGDNPCKYLTNSKGVKIICTSDMKMCKTHKEIIQAAK